MRTLTLASACSLVLGVLALSACSSLPTARPSSEPPPVEAKPAAPRYNLTGYSAGFKQGYADACATPRRRNADRFKSDTNYSMGWQDGSSACRKR